jgi:hypothetical protein
MGQFSNRVTSGDLHVQFLSSGRDPGGTVATLALEQASGGMAQVVSYILEEFHPLN